MQKTWVSFLGWEDPLEKEMTTNSRFLAREPHGQRSLEGCSPWGCKRVHDLDTREQQQQQSLVMLNTFRMLVYLLWENVYSSPLPIFQIKLFLLLLLFHRNSLYTLDIYSLQDTCYRWHLSLVDLVKMGFYSLSSNITNELPGEFLGQRSLMGYSPFGCKETRLSY